MIDPADLPPLVADLAQPGDMVVCLGAGSITGWANALPGELARLAIAAAGRMSARLAAAPGLIARLPAVRGRLIANAPLGKQTWFGAGGLAEVLFRPADAADLAAFLRAVPAGGPGDGRRRRLEPLVRDGGVPGVTIRLGRGFSRIAVEEDGITAGAGALDRIVALAAAYAGVAGLEFLSGIPGTIGGAPAHERRGLRQRRQGRAGTARPRSTAPGILHDLEAAAMGLSYRHCEVDARVDLYRSAASRRARRTGHDRCTD